MAQFRVYIMSDGGLFLDPLQLCRCHVQFGELYVVHLCPYYRDVLAVQGWTCVLLVPGTLVNCAIGLHMVQMLILY